jgi:hypothetical protein
MERIHVAITPENLEFLRDRKKKEFIPIKHTINEALGKLRKELSKKDK